MDRSPEVVAGKEQDMKLCLKQPRNLMKMYRHGGTILPWKTCEPFLENSRAVLIHRPRSIMTIQISERFSPHIAIDCWCGNTMTGTKKFTFLAVPEPHKIVCARCEDKAVVAGLPTSSTLAGRHVHTGGVVPYRSCCTHQE